jgi:hypothetical protein
MAKRGQIGTGQAGAEPAFAEQRMSTLQLND